jgi:hypothetical protein
MLWQHLFFIQSNEPSHSAVSIANQPGSKGQETVKFDPFDGVYGSKLRFCGSMHQQLLFQKKTIMKAISDEQEVAARRNVEVILSAGERFFSWILWPMIIVGVKGRN